MSGVPIRGEQWHLAFAEESVYGTDPAAGDPANPTLYKYPFGIVQTATIPDPDIEYTPFWMMGDASKRNSYLTYRGRRSLQGSISNILLLNGYPLYMPIGTVTDGGIAGAYTHAIAEAAELKSISMAVTHYDATGNVEIMRKYHGGKIGRATYSAREGDFLSMSIDDIQFTSWHHKSVTTGAPFSNAANDAAYQSTMGDFKSYVVAMYPTTQPYIFSYGSLTIAGTEFARIRSFSLSVDNSLEAKYYVTNDATSFFPYEHREGRRQYRLGVTVDVEDDSIFKHLVALGNYSDAFKGFQVVLTFTRDTNDTITITAPPSAPGATGDAQGCLVKTAKHDINSNESLLSVPMDILCRSIKIDVVDNIADYPGE